MEETFLQLFLMVILALWQIEYILNIMADFADFFPHTARWI